MNVSAYLTIALSSSLPLAVTALGALASGICVTPLADPQHKYPYAKVTMIALSFFFFLSMGEIATSIPAKKTLSLTFHQVLSQTVQVIFSRALLQACGGFSFSFMSAVIYRLFTLTVIEQLEA